VSADRVMIISPVRNEAAHIQHVIDGMAAQTRPPDRWVVVDDGSTDDTRRILEGAAKELPFLIVVSAPAVELPAGADRLSHAAAPRVFNHGLAISPGPFTHIGKLDGDIELPPDYFERLLAEFHAHPRLGVAGGVVVEEHGGRWKVHGASQPEHVRGALRLYSQECLTAVGGVQELLGWDGIDLLLARMRGFQTRSLPDLAARHHRHTGTAQGRLKGHVRWGRCQYIQGYPLYWIAIRALKVAGSAPRGVSGLAYLGGYAHAAVRRVPRFDEPGYRGHLRGELRRRTRGKLGRRPSSLRAGDQATRSLPGTHTSGT
jgi:biofilm PGA synthesis N-glycosyltransferase PgaC